MTRSIVVLISHFHVSKNGNSLTTGGKKNCENNCSWLIWDISYDAVLSSMEVSVQWSLLEYWQFRRRQAESRTEVCGQRNRKSWMHCGDRQEFTASNHKWAKPKWAAGAAVQRLMGRTPACDGGSLQGHPAQAAALPCWGLGSQVLQVPHCTHCPAGGKGITECQCCPSLLLSLSAFLANCCQ